MWKHTSLFIWWENDLHCYATMLCLYAAMSICAVILNLSGVCGMTFWDISVMYNELFFLLPLWVHSVTALNRVSELNKVSKMRDINCEQGLSPTLLKQFHHPPENPTSVFLRAGRLYPPSISTLPRLSVSLLFLFPSCSFSFSVFYLSLHLSPTSYLWYMCSGYRWWLS